jgi:hypothetical protein
MRSTLKYSNRGFDALSHEKHADGGILLLISPLLYSLRAMEKHANISLVQIPVLGSTMAASSQMYSLSRLKRAEIGSEKQFFAILL